MSVCNYKYPIVYENATYAGKPGKLIWISDTDWIFTYEGYNNRTEWDKTAASTDKDVKDEPQTPVADRMSNALCAWDASNYDTRELIRHVEQRQLHENDPVEYNRQYRNGSTNQTAYSLAQPLPESLRKRLAMGDHKMYRGGGSRRHKSKQRKSRKNNKSKKRKSRKANRRRR
jgi:hypothetical protein